MHGRQILDFDNDGMIILIMSRGSRFYKKHKVIFILFFSSFITYIYLYHTKILVIKNW